VLVPAASSGIIVSVILAVSRAIGETMIVAIAAGQQPRLTLNPFVPIETITTYIVQVSMADHYGGLRAIAETTPIGELWDSGQAEAERELPQAATEAVELLQALRERGTRVRTPSELCGRPHAAGAARITVLAPCPKHDSGYGENDNSLIVRIDYGARSFLFLGDAEQHQEAKLVASGAARHANVLKVAHHGSRTSSTEKLLSALRPELAIVSAGITNRFGHPHQEVLERLYRHGARVLHLADVGGTIVSTDGEQLQVEPLVAEGEAETQARAQGAIAFSYTR
jgi:competence protein ComEC